MNDLREKINLNLENPDELEQLNHNNPEEFKKVITELFNETPDLLILKFWNSRLNYSFEPLSEPITPVERNYLEAKIVAILILFSGLILNLPSIFYKLDSEMFYLRFLIPVSFGSLAAYLILKLKPIKDIILIQIILFSLSIGLLYIISIGNINTQTDFLAIIHLPFLLWGFIQLNFTGRDIFNVKKGIGYLKLNGEGIVYIGVIVIALQIFNLLVMALFSLVSDNLMDFYMNHILFFYISGVVLAGAVLALRQIKATRFIAPIISKIFSPMILLVVIVFLINYIFSINNPFKDRDFLIVFNFALVIVLLIIVYALVERSDDSTWNVFDYINSSLIILTIIIDLIALMAILFRLSSYGFTPNRIVVLVMNILILANLAILLYHYVKFYLKKSSIPVMKKVIVVFIPIYAIWTFIVVFIFPFVLKDFPFDW